MIVYVYHKCSTCKEALRFLEKTKGKGNFSVKEITVTPPSLEELQQMLKFQKGHLKKLFNTSGQLYRERQLSQKINDMPFEDALMLLTQEGMLVKRPFLLTEETGLVGFNEELWLKILKN